MKSVFVRFGGLVLAAVLCGSTAQAQPRGGTAGPTVGWFKLTADTPLRNHWSLYSEVEARQANAVLAAQYLGRAGLRWYTGRSFSATAGYVLAYNELQATPTALPEHRLYQELALADPSGPLRVGHRLRVEERWMRPAPEAAFRFAPRLRYQLRLVLPLHRGGKLPTGATYLVGADEVFATLGQPSDRSFLEENRLSGGLGCRLSAALSAEISYLHQTQADDALGGSHSRNAWLLTLAATPLRR